MKNQKRFGEILIAKGLVTSRQIEASLKEQVRTKEYIGAILLKNGYIREKDLLMVLSQQSGFPVGKIDFDNMDWDLVKKFSSTLIFDHNCFPVKRDNDFITFAISNPLDVWGLTKAQEEIRGLEARFILVSLGDMQTAIKRYKDHLRDSILGL